MSHFTVAIISDGKTSVEDYLAPYFEGTEDPRYTSFINLEDEHIEEYKTKKKTMVDMGDGSFKELYDEFFFVPTQKQFYDANVNSETIRVWCRFEKGREQYYYSDYSKYSIVERPVSEIYKTFDEYMDSLGYEKDDKEGKYGFWANPNAKWDWYLVGGRWKGLLKASAGKHGDGSLVCPSPNTPGRYDVAKIKDIDFSIDEDAYLRAARFWEVYVEKQPLRGAETPSMFSAYMKPEYYLEQYGTKERYARSQSELSTFAVITNDGTWHEQGQMGWFGISSANGEEVQKWHDSWYDAFIKNVDPEWYVTIVDCHI